MMYTYPWTFCLGLFTACMLFLGLVSAMLIHLSGWSIYETDHEIILHVAIILIPTALCVVVVVTIFTFAIEASVQAMRHKTKR